jgi:hypothetical protein
LHIRQKSPSITEASRSAYGHGRSILGNIAQLL